jgi:hypothetical protein
MFQDLWTLLQPGPEYDGVRRACEKMWDAIPPQRQQLIYDTLSEKKSLGEFIDFNPYYALQKNANPMPHFLDGWEQDDAHAEGIPLVIVRFNRRYLCCTRATMLAHNLPFVRDVLPPDQLPY